MHAPKHWNHERDVWHGRGLCDKGCSVKRAVPKELSDCFPQCVQDKRPFALPMKSLFKNQLNQTSVNNCIRVMPLIVSSKAGSNVSCCTSYTARAWTPSAAWGMSSEPLGAALKLQPAGPGSAAFPLRALWLTAMLRNAGGGTTPHTKMKKWRQEKFLQRKNAGLVLHCDVRSVFNKIPKEPREKGRVPRLGCQFRIALHSPKWCFCSERL